MDQVRSIEIGELDAMVTALTRSHENQYHTNGMTWPFQPDGLLIEQERVTVHKGGRKFFYVDIGSGGAFLVEKATGELYNIKAYGVADYNKKRKADLGNVHTADLSGLYARRYNYLR